MTLTNDIVFITVHLHPELDKGTLKAILKDARISREEFLEYILKNIKFNKIKRE